MRPLPASRDADPGRHPMPPSPQLSCFITTEAALDSSSESHQFHHPPHHIGRWPRHKRSADFASSSSRTADSSPAPAPHSPTSLSSSVLDDDMLHEYIPPMTPVLQGLSGPASAISSSSSRRGSFTASLCADSHSLVASVVSSPRRSPTRRPGPSPQQGTTDTPESQLIMPSLTVPPRRSFSEAGKNIGKLKILVTGPSGIGKTSLINSLTRSCEHIVHVDPARSSSTSASETFASTKPQPRWRTELELSTATRLRRSSVTVSDEILDRNLCFVDTTGVAPSIESFHVAMQYTESQVTPLLYKSMDESDLWSLLISGSQPAVDSVLYMIANTGISAKDIDAMKRLQTFTNVVPLLAQSDELDEDRMSIIRSDIHARLAEHGIECFSFHGPNAPVELFAVSNLRRPDVDEMDASTLMRSEYEQPLMQTDLEQLIDSMICAEGSAWLRHTTALKILKWCKEHRQTGALQLVSQPAAPQHIPFSGFSGMDAHTAAQWWQRVEITNWAESLRRSLDSQSSDFHIPPNALELANRSSDPSRSVIKCERKNRKHKSRPPPSPTHQDPLGLLDWLAQVKQGGSFTAGMLGGPGVAALVIAWLHMSDSACHREFAQIPRGFLSGWWWDIV